MTGQRNQPIQIVSLAEIDSEPTPDPAPSPTKKNVNWRAHRGQVLILMAFAVVGIIGMAGLAIDLGYGMAERRTMQNSADAGALAGAHAIAKSDPSSPSSILTDVEESAWANKMGSSNPTVSTCEYVDDTDSSLGNCSDVVPSGATGVKVVVKETHDTFFVRALPGGPKHVTMTATAIAHVQLLESPPSDGPFLVCGVGAKTTTKGNMDIVRKVDGTWTVNTAAATTSDYAGPTFLIYSPQAATCGAHDSSFKGLASGPDNADISPPNWFNYKTGTSVGTLSSNVNGIEGCKAGSEVINCVAFLPVVVNDPPEVGNSRQMWGVMVLPFYVTADKSNANYRLAQLIGDYVTESGGTSGWQPGYHGPIVIHLTE